MALDVFIDSSFQSNGFTITHQIDEKTIEGFTYVVNSDFQVEQIVFVKSSPNNYIFDMTYQKLLLMKNLCFFRLPLSGVITL